MQKRATGVFMKKQRKINKSLVFLTKTEKISKNI
ncbi:MAG: hypothetical protein IJY89_04270 [Clostridia bacterium]|nr:hypothetical protein [Clostridia bacterium]